MWVEAGNLDGSLAAQTMTHQADPVLEGCQSRQDHVLVDILSQRLVVDLRMPLRVTMIS